jgi:hypothetical protein
MVFSKQCPHSYKRGNVHTEAKSSPSMVEFVGVTDVMAFLPQIVNVFLMHDI